MPAGDVQTGAGAGVGVGVGVGEGVSEGGVVESDESVVEGTVDMIVDDGVDAVVGDGVEDVVEAAVDTDAVAPPPPPQADIVPTMLRLAVNRSVRLKLRFTVIPRQGSNNDKKLFSRSNWILRSEISAVRKIMAKTCAKTTEFR